MRTGALEISQFSLRAIRLGKVNNTLKPTSIAEQPLPTGIISNGLLKDENAFLDNLVKLLKKFHSPGSHWVVTLPEAGIFTMHRIFPGIPQENLKETIEMNYLNFLPGLSQEIFWGWQEVGLIENKKDAPKEVMLSSIKKADLTPYLNCFAKAGITPMAIEPKSCSVARVFGQTQNTLVINLEKDDQNISWILTAVILNNGFPRLAREVCLESQPMEELLRAIRGVINFYLIEQKETQISMIILEGKASNPAIAENLKATFGVEVKFATDIFKTFANPSLSLALLGAGLRAAAGQREDNSLSLLPVGTQEAYQEKNTLQSLRGITNIISITAILFLVLFFGAIIFYFWLANQADRQLANLAANNQSQSDPKITEIQTILKDVNPKIEIEAKLEDQMTAFSPVLKQIAATLPDGVAVSQINLTKEDQPMSLVGSAESREALVTFREDLSKLSFVDSLQLPSSNINQDNTINFTITLTLKKDVLKQQNSNIAI